MSRAEQVQGGDKSSRGATALALVLGPFPEVALLAQLAPPPPPPTPQHDHDEDDGGQLHLSLDSLLPLTAEPLH